MHESLSFVFWVGVEDDANVVLVVDWALVVAVAGSKSIGDEADCITYMYMYTA